MVRTETEAVAVAEGRSASLHSQAESFPLRNNRPDVGSFSITAFVVTGWAACIAPRTRLGRIVFPATSSRMSFTLAASARAERNWATRSLMLSGTRSETSTPNSC